MKRVLAALVLATALPASAEWVQGYVRHDGTYVPGYYRSDANSTKLDNYSTQGNMNPYTGQRGYVNPNAVPNLYQPPVYQQPRIYQPQPNVTQRAYNPNDWVWQNPYATR